MPSIEVARQPLEAPLNDEAKLKLLALQRKYAEDHDLAAHLRKASQLLSETVNPISTAKVERREKYKRAVERLKGKDEDLDPEYEQEVIAFEARVDSVTEKMDHAIRRIIDDRVWNEQLSDNLKHVTGRSTGTQATQRTTQRSIVPTQDATPRRDVDDEEDEEEDPQGPPPFEDTPIALLQAAFATQAARHNTKSLTDRYAHDNDYAGWYRSRHDGLTSHIEHAPPVPNPALWFGREEGRGSPLSAEDDDTNLEVVGERVSLKCPLTTMVFNEPVTSDICQHSYEKAAIMEVLRMSDDRMPFTDEQEAELAKAPRNQRAKLERRYRVPRLQCPHYGCDKYLTENDLRPDPVLQRQAARYKERKRLEEQQDQERNRAAEEDDDAMDVEGEDDEVRIPGTQRRPFGVGSSPVGGRDRLSGAHKVKKELLDRRSRAGQGVQVPSSQPPRGTQIIQMSDGEESE